MVQFAIALLLAAPVLLLVSLFTRATWRAWAGAAMLLMVLGTVAAWLAVGSGHAAGQLVDKTPALVAAVNAHEALGVRTLILFSILTAAFIALMIVPRVVRREIPVALRIGVHAVFLLLYLGFGTVIANTADRGGRLVHELGVKAMVASQVAVSADPAKPSEEPGPASRPQPAVPPR